MNRRRFLVSAALTGISAASSRPSGALLTSPRPVAARARPSARQVAWQNMQLGMFVHFAPNTWQDVESDNLSTPLARIDPQRLNTDQWAETAVALGAKYILFVAKHQGGFCMWQTHTTGYGIRNTPWKNGKGDVLAEVAASCRNHGLKLGVYVCPRDDHFGATTGGLCATPALQARYDQMYRRQLIEVLGNYGPMVEVWFDGSTRTPVGDLLTRYQPQAMVFQGPAATIRWVGNENGYAPYPCWNGIDRNDARSGTATSLNSNPDGEVWMPNEVDVSIRRPNWFWSTKNESQVLSLEQMLSIYYRSVGRGAQLLVNIPANREGLLPEGDCAVAKALGAEIAKRFGTPLAKTSGIGSLLALQLAAQPAVDTIVLEEDVRGGERVRRYLLEGQTSEGWTRLAEGSAIGHKRIQPVPRAKYKAIRLRVTQSAGDPLIHTLAAFDVGHAPPMDWDAPAEAWAANLAGYWKNHHFQLDLSTKIKAAAQYRLRFVALGGRVDGLQNFTLRLHGRPEPALVKIDATHPDAIVLDITEVAESITVEGEVQGTAEGSITLQKL